MAYDLDGTCSCASRLSSCLVAHPRTASASSSPTTTTARTSTARTTSSRAGSTAASTSPTPTTGAGTTGSGWSARRSARTTAASTGSRRAAANCELVVGRGRVRPAQRALLLARRDAALRQRLAARAGQGVRRRRRRLASATAGMLHESIGSGVHGRGQRRRHGVRRARQRLGHRPGRRLGAHARGRAHRHRRDAARSAAASLGRRSDLRRCS